jgi:NAD(P)H-hydrate epimerase
MQPLSRSQLREFDRRADEVYGIATLVLMENAGRAAADFLLGATQASDKIVLVCGPGNNGGDGGVVARHLDAVGRSVRVIWVAEADRLAPLAATQHKILECAGIWQVNWPEERSAVEWNAALCEADWVVDGLLGTGVSREVEGSMRVAIEAVNRSGKPVLALDIPSGLDADTGLPHGIAVRATNTITFAASKLGFNVPGAEAYLGKTVVASIGAPRRLLEEFGLWR